MIGELGGVKYSQFRSRYESSSLIGLKFNFPCLSSTCFFGVVVVVVVVVVVLFTLFTGLSGDRIFSNSPPQVNKCVPHHGSDLDGGLQTALFTNP